jgi:hypothetical protein
MCDTCDLCHMLQRGQRNLLAKDVSASEGSVRLHHLLLTRVGGAGATHLCVNQSRMYGTTGVQLQSSRHLLKGCRVQIPQVSQLVQCLHIGDA